MSRIIKFKPKEKEIPTINSIDNKIIINNINENELHVYCPSGWGDCEWILCKIYDNTDKDIYLHTLPRHVYSAYLLEDLPKIKKVTQNNTYRNYNEFLRKCKNEYNNYSQLNNLNNINEMYLEMNTWVDNGNPISSYLPNLKTTYELPWSEHNIYELKKEFNNDKIIVIYTSSYINNKIGPRHTGTWQFNNWLDLINKLKNDYRVIWVGSKYDIDALQYLQNNLNHTLEYRIDKPMNYLHSLFKISHAGLFYQSGLSCHTILNKLCPTYMLYFNCLQKLPNAISNPDWINNNNYKPVFFNDYKLEETINWIQGL